MKTYMIYAYPFHGYFHCTETLQKNGDILLTGKFKTEKKEYIFIKQPEDTLIKENLK